MANFNLENRFQNAPDVQKSWLFDVYIADFGRVSDNIMKDEDLLLRVRSVTIPSRSSGVLTSNFFGMEQVFAGKPVFTHQMTVICEEFEDQKILVGLTNWQNKIFDVRRVPGSGASQLTKRGVAGYALPVFIRQYLTTGEQSDFQLQLINAWPSEISEVTMDYATQDSVKYSITFNFDFFEVVSKNA